MTGTGPGAATSAGRIQWARAQGDATGPLRRGAWYRVLEIAGDTVVVEVNRNPVRVSRVHVRLVPSPPRRWTVVPRPPNAINVPADWGAYYAACPVCHTRAPIRVQASGMRCPRCGGVFPIGWDELEVKSW